MRTRTTLRYLPAAGLLLAALFVCHFASGATETGLGSIAVVMEKTTPLMRCLRESGATYESVASPLEALTNSTSRILIVDASPENLEILAGAPKELADFTRAGGWVVLCGLFPDGLEYFNKIVGVEHLIRSFEMEDVLFANKVDPLLEGLRSADLFLESGEWSEGPDPVPLRSSSLFTYVVDYNDVAPFSTLPSHWGLGDAQPGSGQWPGDMVNGLTYHPDFGFTIDAGEASSTKWSIAFPREENVIGIAWTPDSTYSRVSQVTFDFNDGGKPALLELDSSTATVRVPVARRKTRQLTIEISKWEKQGSTDKVGLRNLAIEVQRPPEFHAKVAPLLSVGGLVKYPMGQGGVLLNQLHILEKESNPVNGEKKRLIAHTILSNLQRIGTTAK